MFFEVVLIFLKMPIAEETWKSDNFLWSLEKSKRKNVDNYFRGEKKETRSERQETRHTAVGRLD